MAKTEMRAMQLCDLDAILDIELLCFSTPWSRESFRVEIEENRCARYVVLLEDGRPVAYAGTWMVIDEGHITNIAVHPDFRRKGYGQRITKEMMRTAKQSGVRWMSLEVRRGNVAAQTLYSKLGFIEAGVRKHYYEDNGEDAILMVVQDMDAALVEL